MANRSAAGRARVRVVVTIEEERRIICAPGGGRNRMITLDALRMLDMDDLVRIKMEHLLIAVNGTKGPIRTGGILSLRVKCEPREPAAKQPLSARDGFSPLWGSK
jgi:hypothetical protein